VLHADAYMKTALSRQSPEKSSGMKHKKIRGAAAFLTTVAMRLGWDAK